MASGRGPGGSGTGDADGPAIGDGAAAPTLVVEVASTRVRTSIPGVILTAMRGPMRRVAPMAAITRCECPVSPSGISCARRYVEDFVCACPCRKTGGHFSGTCANRHLLLTRDW